MAQGEIFTIIFKIKQGKTTYLLTAAIFPLSVIPVKLVLDPIGDGNL